MFGPGLHRNIFLFGVFGLAFGMMIGTVPTSVPILILLGNWLLEGSFREKWNKIKKNRIFWILSSVLFIHAIGLLYTSNLGAGWDDVRTKMPLLLLPLVFFSTNSLSQKELHRTLFFFLLGTFVNLSWCGIYTFLLHHNETVRSASRFMSHIRLGLYLNMAIVVSVYFIQFYRSLTMRILLGLLLFYFLFFMYALGLASGMANFCILLLLFAFYLSYKKGTKWLLLSATTVVLIFFFIASYITRVYKEQFTIKTDRLNEKILVNTEKDNYYHFEGPDQIENGYRVNINIQLMEVYAEWKRRCPDDTFSYNPKFNLERFQVLIRYLSSKGLTKDSVGIAMLKEEDLTNIKKGITNYAMNDWSYFHKRIYELVNEYEEYRMNKGISGHSLTMRLVFWKTAIYCIEKNILTGVGTGDVQEELNKAYNETHAPLSEEWHKRPHNQFLTVTLALGIFGLIVFLISVFAPVFQLRKKIHLLYLPFFVMLVISFLMEDTLESQAGLTFYAFFNTIFIVYAYLNKIDQKVMQS